MPPLNIRPAWSHRVPALIVITATILFLMFFGFSNWFRHTNILTSQFDMGNMDQVLWHSVHGHIFQMNDPNSFGRELRTAIHADYLLLVYAPFYALWPDPRLSLVLQVVAVASGVWPLWWMARKRLGAKAAAMIAVLYLAYPTLEWAMTFDLHAVVLASPLFLWAWWAATERRWWIYGLTVGLALLAKEEVGLVVAAMGLYWIWQPGYRRMAIASIVVGITWTACMLTWAIPSARHAGGHFALHYYSAFGTSYQEIVTHLITHPWQAIATAFDHEGLVLLRGLLVPVGLIAVLGLPVVAIALPEIGINLLSSEPNQRLIFFQYMSAITPFIFLAVIDGWDRGRRWLQMRNRPRSQARIERAAVIAAVGMALAGIWFWSPLPGSRHSAEALRVFQASPYKADIETVQRQLQPDDRVASTNNLVPQFSRRESIWAFPNDLEHADVIVVLEGGTFDAQPPEAISQKIQDLTRDPVFHLVYH